jgi:hypothetical protein
VFIVTRHYLPQQDASKAGLGGLIDAGFFWGVAWAMFAAAAGTGLAAAAIALFRRIEGADYDFAAGYNALAPVLND